MRADRLDQLYCMLAATPHPCCVVVPPQSSGAVLAFLEEHPGTANDFECIICTVTPNEESQQAAAQTIIRLADMGVDCANIRVALTGAPDAVPVREAFGRLVGHLSTPRLEGISLDAVLQASRVFERVKDLQLPISSILQGTVDFQDELAHAREAGEPEHNLHALARKLLVQRALLGCEHNITQALDALRLPRTKREDWLRATSGASACPPRLAVNQESPLTSGEATRAGTEPLQN